jgi:Bacterial SH3 domain
VRALLSIDPPRLNRVRALPRMRPRSCLHAAKTGIALAGLLFVTLFVVQSVSAAEFRSTDAPTVLYDAPSARAKPLFVLGRDTPLEVIVSIEGWTKVRDVAGSIGWVDRKALADKRLLVVRTPVAEVLASPDPAAPIVFRAEHNVILELAEPATSAATTSSPGWVKVRHRDGDVGYVRIAQVFGL